MAYRKNKLKQKGQSLLETVFALGVLLIAVSGVLALTASGIIGQKESESQIIANNLAREGIEVVRHLRDSNWLADIGWDFGFNEGRVAIADFSRTENRWQLIFDFSDDSLYTSFDGLYSHDETGRKTPFSRCLIIDSICQDKAFGAEAIKFSCAADERKIGVKVASEVSWSERGRTRQVTIEDLLYDWK